MSEQATARYRNDFLKEVEKNVEEGHWVKMCMQCGVCAGSCPLGPAWALVFATALSGQGGVSPADGAVEAALQRMVEAVKSGNLSGLIPFDRRGKAVQLA